MNYELIKYEAKDISLDIRFSKEENTAWMSQSEMAILFGASKYTISRRIKELSSYCIEKPSVVAKIATTGVDGKEYKTTHYNLDIIRQIGYKINPLFTDDFVSWVKDELKKLNNEFVPIESNIIRFDNGNVILDVTVEPKEDTVYLDKDQLVILFDTTRRNIEYHITNIIESGELDFAPTCKEILQVHN